jgi:hypothetical protein
VSWRASSRLTVTPRACATRRDVVEEIHHAAQSQAPEFAVVIGCGRQGSVDLNEPPPYLGEEISVEGRLLIRVRHLHAHHLGGS